MESIRRIEVQLSTQRLIGFSETDSIICSYRIASAKNGIGQQQGSECTPLGEHRIRAKIGYGAAINSVFVGRRFSGEIYSEKLASQSPSRDWILTRIMWLCGNQVGLNRGADVDTMRRYIYIHGAPDSHPMGVPSSHGCIKMRNADILELYQRVSVGTTVNIVN